MGDLLRRPLAELDACKSAAPLDGRRESLILFVFLLHRNKTALIIYLLNTEDFVRIPWRFPSRVTLPSNTTEHYEGNRRITRIEKVWNGLKGKLKENQPESIKCFGRDVAHVWLGFSFSLILLEHHVGQISFSATKTCIFSQSTLYEITHKMRAVKKLDEDAVEVCSHDGCLYHFLNYSVWPCDGANMF